MNKNHIMSITEALGEIYSTIESEAIKRITKQLATGDGKSKSEWRKYQFNSIGKLKKTITSDINDYIDKLSKSLENASKLALDNATKGDNLKVDDRFLKKQNTILIKELKKLNSENINLLSGACITLFKSNVNKVYSQLPRVEKIQLDDLYKQIEKVVNGIGVENAPKIPYKSSRTGKTIRNVSWRSYMEMKVRTEIATQTTEYQLEASRRNKIVLYLCNSFSNCADDHKDYQAKIYYDKKVFDSMEDNDEKNVLDNYIKKHKILDVEQVMYKKPFLCTRPNCRHRLKPMLVDDVLNKSVKTLLNENKMQDGKYEAKNYKAMQQQRSNERNIRKYKERLDNNEELLKKAKTDEQKELIQNKINKDKELIRKWQKKNNALVKGNKTLERDYRKEDYRRLVKDLGIKYNS